MASVRLVCRRRFQDDFGRSWDAALARRILDDGAFTPSEEAGEQPLTRTAGSRRDVEPRSRSAARRVTQAREEITATIVRLRSASKDAAAGFWSGRPK